MEKLIRTSIYSDYYFYILFKKLVKIVNKMSIKLRLIKEVFIYRIVPI